jgi:hypothetical protein
MASHEFRFAVIRVMASDLDVVNNGSADRRFRITSRSATNHVDAA